MKLLDTKALIAANHVSIQFKDGNAHLKLQLFNCVWKRCPVSTSMFEIAEHCNCLSADSTMFFIIYAETQTDKIIFSKFKVRSKHHSYSEGHNDTCTMAVKAFFRQRFI